MNCPECGLQALGVLGWWVRSVSAYLLDTLHIRFSESVLDDQIMAGINLVPWPLDGIAVALTAQLIWEGAAVAGHQPGPGRHGRVRVARPPVLSSDGSELTVSFAC